MKAKIKLNDYKFNTIKISGSKNSSLPIIAGSILCDEQVTINNVPNIDDVNALITLLKKIGYDIHFNNNTVIVNPNKINKKEYKYKEIKKLRGSYYLMGSIIGNNILYCNFSFLFPGGCKLGTRPINYHIEAFRNMGLSVTTKKRKIIISGIINRYIHTLSFPSVGTTINIILSSCKNENKTIIYNASIEPEVIDLCNFLISMGVDIKIENRTITIRGNSYLHHTNYTVMEDRIEAGTFLILGAIHKGIKITSVNPSNLTILINLLQNIGYTIKTNKNSITLFNNNVDIKPFDIKLEPFPGFPTDLGPLLCVLASQISGTSTIKETVFLDRYSHISELKKLNINIKKDKNNIIITGKNNIINNKVISKDLRCSACLLIAGSLNTNYTIIQNIELLFRGYEDIKYKLNKLGIDFII